MKQIKEEHEHLNTVIEQRNMETVKISSLLYVDEVVLIAKTKNKIAKISKCVDQRN